jgi:hypothetical protein
MSEWGIALIAAGSAILGSSVTGFFAWKAGHRQAAAAETAGREQAAALISTVQATLDEQRRSRALDQRRQAYAELLAAGSEWQSQGLGHGPRMLSAFGLVELEGPISVTAAAALYFEGVGKYVDGRRICLDELMNRRDRYIEAVLRALNET